MRTFLIIGAVAVSAVLSTSAWSESKGQDVGNKKAMCEGCHGIPDYRMAYPEVYEVPKLGGQHPRYIVTALKAYKDGTRAHATMQAIASSLTEQDMADLAAYYGGSAADKK